MGGRRGGRVIHHHGEGIEGGAGEKDCKKGRDWDKDESSKRRFYGETKSKEEEAHDAY